MKSKLVFLACSALILGIAWTAQRREPVGENNPARVTKAVSKEIINIEEETDQKGKEIVTPHPQPKDKKATIVSFGDTLCHSQVFKAVYKAEINDYDFSPMFQYVKKHFKQSTINIGNLESSFGGKERGYSGYPLFNAPEHLAIDLKELGVDIMTTPNNHRLFAKLSG